MSIDLKTYGKKDAKIIRENPGKNAYDLKELGITDKTFERLMTEGYDGTFIDSIEKESEEEKGEGVKKEKPKPELKSNAVKPVVTEVNKAKPVLSKPVQSFSGVKGIKVKNKKTGKISNLSPKAAERLLKNANQFERIV